MRLPLIDRFAYQLWNDRVSPKMRYYEGKMSD